MCPDIPRTRPLPAARRLRRPAAEHPTAQARRHPASKALALLGASIGALALAGPASSVQAAPFTAPYVFSGTSTGSAGWSSADVPSPTSWYSTTLGAGGIKISPTGGGGQIYDNDLRGGTQFTAPAGTTILSAALTGVDGRGADGERARVNLPPQPYFELLGGESWGKATTVDGTTLPGSFTLTPPVGQTASALQVRLYPIACGNPAAGQPDCVNAPANSQARMNVDQVTVTLDDPTPPAVALSGVAGGWTNASSVTPTVTGADTESGTSRVALDVRAGSSTKHLTLGTWAQDTSGNSLPGWAQSQAGSTTVQLPRTGSVTLTGRASNGANVESGTGPVTIQIDRVAPKITWPKKLQGGQTVTVRDGESGLATATASLDGQPVAFSCPAGSKQCKLRIPTKARGALQIAATDLAGNPATQSREVVPAPRKGGSSSNGGGSRHPDKGGGTKKPTASYCKKHPTARACTGGSGGSGKKKRPGRAVPRGTKLSKIGKISKAKVPKGCRQRVLALGGAGSFAINNLCTTDKILWRGKAFTGICQGKHDIKVKGKTKRVHYQGCRYQVQQIRPQGQNTGYYCAIVPLETTNANPGPAGSGIGRASRKKSKVKVSKGTDPCAKDLRQMCSDGYKNCNKKLVAEYVKRCKSKKSYIPVAAIAAMTNASTAAGTKIHLNQNYLTARKYQLPLCAGVNPMPDKPGTKKPKRGKNAPGPTGEVELTSFTCGDTLTLVPPPPVAPGAPASPTPTVMWRWLSKDGKYVMVRTGPEVLGGSHWVFIPVEALLGLAPPATVPERAMALCRLSEGLTDPALNPTITIAGQNATVPQWGNVQVCGVFKK